MWADEDKFFLNLFHVLKRMKDILLTLKKLPARHFNRFCTYLQLYPTSHAKPLMLSLLTKKHSNLYGENTHTLTESTYSVSFANMSSSCPHVPVTCCKSLGSVIPPARILSLVCCTKLTTNTPVKIKLTVYKMQGFSGFIKNTAYEHGKP